MQVMGWPLSKKNSIVWYTSSTLQKVSDYVIFRYMASKDISLLIANKLRENAPNFFPSYAAYRKPHFIELRESLKNRYKSEEDPERRREIEQEGKYVRQVLDALTLET